MPNDEANSQPVSGKQHPDPGCQPGDTYCLSGLFTGFPHVESFAVLIKIR
jgi:hypothetical protein